ncbi:MAG: endo-1,4-beta-xylanase [Phycisphaerales bacterium]
MLSFLIFDGDRRATARVLRHAHLVGPDGVPVAGEVHFEDGLVHCVKATAEAVGLATQVDLDEATLNEFAADLDPDQPPLRPLGSLTLVTCLLPERKTPYLLSLELARHQIMLVLNKLEEWQLFDLDPSHPIMRTFEAARQSFTRSLVAQRKDGAGEHFGFSLESHRLALLALWHAVEAGEQLALHDATRRFSARCDGTGYDAAVEAVQGGPPSGARGTTPVANPNGTGVVLATRPAVGCVASPGAFSEAAQRAMLNACDFVSIPMRWVDLEPNEGQYAYTPTDRWIEWAVRTARIPVAGGPVIDFSPECVPEWLFIWENDYETLRELVYEHMKAVVTRYRRTVSRWTVVSGLHANSNFKLSFEQMMDLTRICVLVVRKLHSSARIQVEISQPWGEYYTSNRGSLPPMLYAEMLAQAGIHVDSVGLRVIMGTTSTGGGTRDLLSLSAMLDRYAALERPIAVSLAGAPSMQLPTPEKQPDLAPGWWRAPWSEQAQADWCSAALSIALSKPFVESVCWAEIADTPRPGPVPKGALLARDGHPRPALERLTDLRRAAQTATAPERVASLDVLAQHAENASA